jgi:hypothetical protein
LLPHHLIPSHPLFNHQQITLPVSPQSTLRTPSKLRAYSIVKLGCQLLIFTFTEGRFLTSVLSTLRPHHCPCPSETAMNRGKSSTCIDLNI